MYQCKTIRPFVVFELVLLLLTYEKCISRSVLFPFRRSFQSNSAPYGQPTRKGGTKSWID